MTVDGAWCLIGSSNWDVRSFRLNFELDMEICQPALIRRIETLMEAMQHEPITGERLMARSLPERLLHAAARLLFPYL
jgi:cardiolipin synthase